MSQITKPPNWTILDTSVFENCILADEPFAKDLRNLEACASVNNNLCRNPVSSLKAPATFE